MRGHWAVSVIASILITSLVTLNAYAMFLTPVEIIDSTGDGSSALDGALGVAIDSSGNVFVGGFFSDNAFKITSGGAITEIIDSTGDGSSALDIPLGVATDSSDNVFVAGLNSDNAFKIQLEPEEKKSCDALDKASEKGKGKKKGLERAKANNDC